MTGRVAGWVVLLLVAGACGAPPPTVHHVAEGAAGPYSGAVEAGELVFVAGKVGERGGSFEHEVETALDRVEGELSDLGLSLADLVSVTVYLTDMDDYDRFNELYAARVPAPWPARACVAVAALPVGARVEIVATARRQP